MSGCFAEEIRTALFEARDEQYKTFHSKLLPTIEASRLIGVRMPIQRKIAKAYRQDARVSEYLAMTHHDYLEEINVHGFFIDELKDFDDCVTQTQAFLPQLDNWATCDTFSPKIFKKYPAEVEVLAFDWMEDAAYPYTVRFGINTLMRHYLGEYFKPFHLEKVAACCSDEYYVNMGVAWYFSMALAKRYEMALPWIAEKRLPEWVHRKSIQKAIESRQVPVEHKKILKTYR
ncbi:MAG: DNA alkylation repair protein [Peptococcaceae bacterium]|nr:DNA alkylation repair protein [Peptococcaceae bacterium]